VPNRAVEKPFRDFETRTAGVKALVPKEIGQGRGSRAKSGKFCKHLNYLEFVKHEENVGKHGEKSVKNPEKGLKFSANYCFVCNYLAFVGVFRCLETLPCKCFL
jgi:hypothetical protein